MFSVVFGCFQFGAAGPHIRSVSEGKIAGKLAYDVIDHIPGIIPNEPNTKIVDRSSL